MLYWKQSFQLFRPKHMLTFVDVSVEFDTKSLVEMTAQCHTLDVGPLVTVQLVWCFNCSNEVLHSLLCWSVCCTGGNSSAGCYSCCVSFQIPLLSKVGKGFRLHLSNVLLWYVFYSVWLDLVIVSFSHLWYFESLTVYPWKIIKKALVIWILHILFWVCYVSLVTFFKYMFFHITVHFAGRMSLFVFLSCRWVDWFLSYLIMVFQLHRLYGIEWCSGCEWLIGKDVGGDCNLL